MSDNGHIEPIDLEPYDVDLGDNGFVGDPWDRQPGETDLAFQAFRIYRDLGMNRTVLATEQVYREQRGGRKEGDVASGQFNTWSAAHRWRARVAAWEEHQDHIAIRAMKRSRIKMTERHAAVMEAAQRAFFAPIEEFVKRLAEGRVDLSKTTDVELLQLARQVADKLDSFQKAERIARGMNEGDGPDVYLFGAIAQRAIDNQLESAEAKVVPMRALPSSQNGTPEP